MSINFPFPSDKQTSWEKYADEIAVGQVMRWTIRIYLGLQDKPVMVFLGGLAMSQWDPLNLSWNRKNETFLNDF